MTIKDRQGNAATSATKSVVMPGMSMPTFGTATPGCHGPFTLGMNSAPTINNLDFQLTCTGAPPEILQLCVVSDVAGTGVCELCPWVPVDIWASIVPPAVPLFFDAISGVTGKMFSQGTGIPDNNNLINKTYYVQFITFDAGCTAPFFATSPGGSVTILP